MADSKDAHIVVEIPVDEEHQQKLTFSAMQNHPLSEISQSPGHLLLLKLWQREEDLFGRRIAMKEIRLDSIKTETTQLCFFFFIFHAFFSTILFTSSINNNNPEQDRNLVCHSWWIPSILSLFTSIVLIFLVQMRLCRYWKVWRELQREKESNRAVGRCVQELRMKGASFDLDKEPQSGKRMKSSSVEIKWKPLTWCSRWNCYLKSRLEGSFFNITAFYHHIRLSCQGMKLLGPIFAYIHSFILAWSDLCWDALESSTLSLYCYGDDAEKRKEDICDSKHNIETKMFSLEFDKIELIVWLCFTVVVVVGLSSSGKDCGCGGGGSYVERVDLGCFALFDKLETTANGGSHRESVLAKKS
ncbi:hypothetical protein TEA_027091 [Camellia sinensis var. sinensis]|uniref:Uncharacterized protein n=1 Tax=Camellia sinensis var. sinensis TaxID=542762 RepID=A0A4S4D7Z5_CAMSN|nr:hypothetical protein TEA_027091 [Camellia sinensis var. sinensis]